MMEVLSTSYISSSLTRYNLTLEFLFVAMYILTCTYSCHYCILPIVLVFMWSYVTNGCVLVRFIHQKIVMILFIAFFIWIYYVHNLVFSPGSHLHWLCCIVLFTMWKNNFVLHEIWLTTSFSLHQAYLHGNIIY